MLLLLSAFRSRMSAAVQWQHHQPSAVAAADAPASSVQSSIVFACPVVLEATTGEAALDFSEEH